VILMEGPDKHNGKDYWFSADALTTRQVAETLTAATVGSSQQQFRMPEFHKPCGAAPVQHSNQRIKGRIRVVSTKVEERKNGVRWKRHRRY